MIRIAVCCLIIQSCLGQRPQEGPGIVEELKRKIEEAKNLTKSQTQFNEAASNYLTEINVEAASRSMDSVKAAVDNYFELEKSRFKGLGDLARQGIGLVKENAQQIPSESIRNSVEGGTDLVMSIVERVLNTSNDLLDRYKKAEDDRIELAKIMASDAVVGLSHMGSALKQGADTIVDVGAVAVEGGVDQAMNVLGKYLRQSARGTTAQLTSARSEPERASSSVTAKLSSRS